MNPETATFELVWTEDRINYRVLNKQIDNELIKRNRRYEKFQLALVYSDEKKAVYKITER